MAWPKLSINIFAFYVLECEVANFVPPPTLHHLTTSVTLIIISNHQETGVCDSANQFGPREVVWRIGGRVQEWTLFGRCQVRCTDVCEAICNDRCCSLPFPLSSFSDFAGLHHYQRFYSVSLYLMKVRTYCSIERRVMAAELECHDPPSYADGRAYTDSSWRVCQVVVERIEEEEATFWSCSIAGYWAQGGNPISSNINCFKYPKNPRIRKYVHRGFKCNKMS